MSDTGPILRLLDGVRRRVRTNRLAQELTDGAIRLLGTGAALVLWNRIAPVRWMLGWPVFVVLGLGVIAITLARLLRGEPLWKSAAHADRVAELQDEMTSAYWFARHPEDSDWVEAHVDRASNRAATLRPETLVPFERPGRAWWPAALVVVIAALSVAPVPRVFEQLVDRLAELDLGGRDVSGEPVAELEEANERNRDDAFDDQPLEEDRALLPQLQEQQPGDTAPPEDALSEESEEPDPEGQTMEGEEGQQEGEPGEDTEGQPMDAQNPEDMPADSEGEPSPDPNASEQEGQGESTEDTGAMLPGGDEVFLQEGGEDLEQTEAGEEELGHATREGGGEEDLDMGEMTTLDVQLQREILAVPEPIQDEEAPEEEKEELITRSERSYLDFERVEIPAEFEKQELLEGEPIPWRYRQLVLAYFKTLRERDNQRREERQ